MQLTKVDTLLARLALSSQEDDDNFLSVVSSALDAATLFLEGQLDTTFEKESFTDTFFIDSTVYQAYGRMYQLKLSHGFVDSSTLVLTKVDDLFDQSLSPVQLTAQEFLVNPKGAEKGFIDISDTLRDVYLQVSYASGFEDVSEVPDWLSEASMAHAISVMGWQQVGDDKPALTKVAQDIANHKGAILNRHMRTSSRAIPPIRTV